MKEMEDRRKYTAFTDISHAPDEMVGAIFDGKIFEFGKFVIKADVEADTVTLSNRHSSYVAKITELKVDNFNVTRPGERPNPNVLANVLKDFVDASDGGTGGAGDGVARWGNISGRINSQIDLRDAFKMKANKFGKVTYTAGEPARAIVIDVTDWGALYMVNRLSGVGHSNNFFSIHLGQKSFTVWGNVQYNPMEDWEYGFIFCTTQTGGEKLLWYNSWHDVHPDVDWQGQGYIYQDDDYEIKWVSSDSEHKIVINQLGLSPVYVDGIGDEAQNGVNFTAETGAYDLEDVSNASYVYANYLDQDDFELDSTTEKIKLKYIPGEMPIGYVYLSTDNTDPATLFGYGTWEAFGQGKCLIGVDSTDTDFNTSLKTGGAKTHTLTAAQMPSHNHYYGYTEQNTNTSYGGGSYHLGNSVYSTGNGSYTSSTGSGSSHNNLQPYITVYMFRRTA